MTALTLRASQAILTSPFAVLGRLLTITMNVVDVVSDAQVRASAATRRFPLAS